MFIHYLILSRALGVVLLGVVLISFASCSREISFVSPDAKFSDITIVEPWYERSSLTFNPEIPLHTGDILSITTTNTSDSITSTQSNVIVLLQDDTEIARFAWKPLPADRPITRTMVFESPNELQTAVDSAKVYTAETSEIEIQNLGVNNSPAYSYIRTDQAIQIPNDWVIISSEDGTKQTEQIVFSTPLDGPASLLIRTGIELGSVSAALYLTDRQEEPYTKRYTLSDSYENALYALTIPNTATITSLTLEGITNNGDSRAQNPASPNIITELTVSSSEIFPAPIDTDIGHMLENPPDQWRNSTAELYSWSNYPSILVLVSQTLGIQSRYFKRLAFFAEKRDFRGTILSDSELVGRHGWNAHNYHSSDLARFFSLVEEEILTEEEKSLRDILIYNKIIIPDVSGFIAGSESSGILGISWDLGEYLRLLLLTHEALHGLYYAEPSFQTKVEDIWERLTPEMQTFFQFMFSAYSYDGSHIPLVQNEMQAYLLQQPIGNFDSAMRRVENNLKRFRPANASYIEDFFENHIEILRSLAVELDSFLKEQFGLSSGDLSRVTYTP